MATSTTPSLDGYLAALPHGIDSYANCQQKAFVVRQFLETPRIADLVAVLPPGLEELATSPPPATEWVSEVKATALYLALRDVLGSDEAFFAYCLSGNRRLLSSPVYRILFALVSPVRVLKGAKERWAQMHRGTELRPRSIEKDNAVFRLTCPENLVPLVIGQAYGTAYRAALELAGGEDVTVECIEPSPTGFSYLARWR